MTACFVKLLIVIFAVVNVEKTAGQNESADAKEMEYLDGTSVEPAYLLPQVNITAPGAGDNSGESLVSSVSASLSRVLNFYNTELLTANWGSVKETITLECIDDMEKYLDGLSRGSNWALKSKKFLQKYILLFC